MDEKNVNFVAKEKKLSDELVSKLCVLVNCLETPSRWLNLLAKEVKMYRDREKEVEKILCGIAYN